MVGEGDAETNPIQADKENTLSSPASGPAAAKVEAPASLRDDAPLEELEASSNVVLCAGQASMQGARQTQEDRTWLKPTDYISSYAGVSALFVVADGHVGDCAAEFAIRQLPRELLSQLEGALEKGPISDANSDPRSADEPLLPPNAYDENALSLPQKRRRTDDALEQSDTAPPTLEHKLRRLEGDQAHEGVKVAVARSYAQVDADFLRLNRTSRAGSTCSSVIILGNYLVSANVGDSRTILISQPSTNIIGPRPRQEPLRTERLSVDHKPGVEAEKTRIERDGGTVKRIGGCWRIVPVADPKARTTIALAVSRAIGDKDLKQFVIGEPHLAALSLQPDEHKAIILATDGVWDTVADDQAAACVMEHHDSRDADAAARELVKLAYRRGSEDNISCIVVFIYRQAV